MPTETPRYFFIEEEIPLSGQIVEAVSSVAETEPSALPSLQAVVDTDALNAIARGQSTTTVSLFYAGYHVTILNGVRLVVREPDSLHASLTTVSNVLVPTTDRDQSCSELLIPYPPAWENVLDVSYGEPTVRVDGEPAETGIVSVGGFTRSASASSAETPAGVPSVTCVDDPSDLSALDTAINEQVSTWRANDNQTVVCFHSVTDLLTHVDSAAAWAFLDRLSSALSAAGALTYYYVDPEHCSTADLDRLGSIVDATVERGDAGYQLSSSNSDDPTKIV